MKKLLLGIIAINLTFISADLALSSVGPNHDTHATAQDLNELDSDTTGTITAVKPHAYEDSGEGDESINANTTGAITLDGGEDSDEGEEDPE